MTVKHKEGSLTHEEKRVVKALLAKGWRNQDIQALVNVGRSTTINSARITEVKQGSVKPASDETTEFYLVKKRSFDHRTGLNFYDDERLIRSREAMLLAVQIFNSPTLRFKTEVFAVLVTIAWTYLLHEFYIRKGVSITDETGHTPSISHIIQRPDCSLSKGIKNNLLAIKEVRDDVEHKLLRRSDSRWLTLFQACCLNYDKTLCEWFGERLSLQADLSLALQFARLSVDQIAALEKYDVPEHIEALDARLDAALTEEDKADLEYRFRVVYTLDSASKGRAHIQFLHPESSEAEQVRNVLVKYKPADELYPYKPGPVVKAVQERSGRRFTSHNHTQAWKKYKVRPKSRAKKPGDTDRRYCLYHIAHRDYTYSDAWIDFLVEEMAVDQRYEELLAVRV